MKIRRIEIQGFKSFADRTVFEFEAGISAIVGPNGCGKSNVVDALKWVLGDMSPRSLRGKRMEDVIFAGSRGRKPLPMAEVTLVLDNEDGLLPSEHAEVAITRRLDRTGESQYLINREPCRLKDVRELFLDTGVGTEGNAIMEQGQIDALLAANPQDRRGIFEEAAGVSRYKQRRKEADQRLARTQENLERLRDVLELEEKRLRSLKGQAARARRYTEVRDELLRKRTLRAVVRYRAVCAEREAVQARMGEALEREAEAARELAGIEEHARAVDAARDAARTRVHDLEARIARAASDARAAQDRAGFAERTIAELRERVAGAEAEARRAREQAEGLAGEITRLAEERARTEAEGGGLGERVAEAERELARLEQEAAAIRDAHEGAKQEALAALGRISALRNEEAERRGEIRQAEERLERLVQQQAEGRVRLEALGGEARELAALAASLEAQGRERARHLEALESERARLLAAAEAAGRRCGQLAEERATRGARLEVLRGLAAAQEGVEEGARQILGEIAGLAPEADGTRRGVLGLLADLLAPAPQDAARLDRLLGHAGGALVVRSARDALRWIEWLRARGQAERARFLCLDLVKAPAERSAIPLGPLGCDERVAALVRSAVAGTVLVPDLRAGIQEHQERGVNAVTPEGDRVTASGALVVGRDPAGLGLVERGAEIRQLAEEGERLEAAVAAARAETLDLEGRGRELEERIRQARTELAHHAADSGRRGEALLRVERERQQAAEALGLIEADRRELEARLAEARAAARALGEAVAALEGERAALEERAAEAGRGYLAVDAARKEASERRMEARLAAATARSRLEAARQRLARAHEDRAALEERAAAHRREAQELGARIDAAEVDLSEAAALARAKGAERAQEAEALLAARAALAEAEAGFGGAEERRREVQRLHERLRDELEAFRLRDGEYRTRLEALVEQVRQDQGLELEALAAATEPTESLDLGNLDAELADLRERLEALGNVNLNALEELREVEAHVTNLQTQERDLLDARGGLETAIKELDAISTERFTKAFEQIRENFQHTFRRLFGGGRAEVMLEDASNVLESGIEILARPPGKEQRTISLLSGGERTLTAVALLFAVFQAKPSPFAVLDEVDAALDEANVRRLISLVREFVDRCQFIVITHAKATMESADLLYGVTMPEPGVSTKVAVRLTEYTDPVVAAGA